MTDVLVVLCTFPDGEVARQIGTHLVERQYAACANFLPEVESVYRWRGELCQAKEALVMFKTSRQGFESLSRELIAMHPYEEPEVIALPVADGSSAYLNWVLDGVR